MLQLEPWQWILLFSMAAGLAGTCFSVTFRYYDKSNELRFKRLEDNLESLKKEHDKLADGAMRREDWVRYVTQTERALDKLQVSFDALLKQLVANNQSRNSNPHG